jgi:hypothetical protein
MQKILKTLKTLFVLLILVGCTDDERDLSYLSSIELPSNISVSFNITQDNTGAVTLSPSADATLKFEIFFGDDTPASEEVVQGQSLDHIYVEGNYDVRVIAYNIKGETAEITQPLVVSFTAPENLVVTIENDAAISKQVNVTATADFAAMYDFYSGEDGVTDPISGNIGDTISYTYAEPGTYTIRIVAKGAAIETTEYTVDFEVTAILAPIASAPLQPSRNESDVISIYSSVYTDVADTDTFPDWGQGGQGSSWGTYDLSGDSMLQYTNISYQGIQIGSPQDVSSMEFIHLDVWTADIGQQLETSLISLTSGENPVVSDLTPNAWTSLDIPISVFTDQGLTVADIHQLKFVGIPWASGTVFIDNIYFYKAPSGVVTSSVQDFEGPAPTFTVFGNIAATEVIANPDVSGVNTTDNVARLTKTAGSEVWAGTFFETTTPLDLVNYSKISLKTWSPIVGAQVKLKLENADASIVYEVDINTTVANTWEELLYDFTDAPIADYVRVVTFFDFGNAGDDSLYYYDEIELVNDSGGVAPSIFQDFEATAPTFTVFGNIAATEVIANPDVSGINTTDNVAKLTKTSGSEVWAGTFFETVTPLDFATYSKISLKAWSPIVGAQVKLKLENADASIVHEVDLDSNVANAWEELLYDFTDAPVADYVRVVIFFDFGNPGDDSLYYYDELTLTN